VTDPEESTGERGDAIVRGALAGTALFVVAATLATIWPDALAVPAAVVHVGLFVVGCVAFLVAYGVAVSRSRTEEISVVGVYFLSGSAPGAVRRALMGAFALQVVVAVASASIRPFTSVAFGILVPVFGLGLAGLWGARHGSYPAKAADDGGRGRRRTA
jgi:hypothetical protein